MEKNSTPPADLLPRAANLVTLAVVVAATWWSGAQRPAGPAVLAASPPAAMAPAPRQSAVAITSTAAWPSEAATTVARDGLQTVGYQTRTR